jgi:predicted GNAT family acetyltransferase
MSSRLNARRFAAAEEFLAEAGAYLGAREAEHNLLLGLAGVLIAKPNLYGSAPYFAAVERDGRVVAAALRTPPHNLVLSEVTDPAAIEALATDVAATFGELPGVLGPKEVSRRFAELWSQATGGTAERASAERIFRAESARAPAGVSGSMRRASAADRGLLVEWIAAFQHEAMRGRTHRSPDDAVEDYLTRGDEGGVYLWEDGTPVSLAGCGGPTPNGIRIGPVYTPPERRRRGYASALTAELTTLLLSSGRRFCFLFTDLANPTSNRIYQGIGYKSVTDVDEWRFSRHGAAPHDDAAAA